MGDLHRGHLKLVSRKGGHAFFAAALREVPQLDCPALNKMIEEKRSGVSLRMMPTYMLAEPDASRVLP